MRPQTVSVKFLVNKKVAMSACNLIDFLLKNVVQILTSPPNGVARGGGVRPGRAPAFAGAKMDGRRSVTIEDGGT